MMYLVTKSLLERGKGLHVEDRFLTEDELVAEAYKFQNENVEFLIYVDIEEIEIR